MTIALIATVVFVVAITAFFRNVDSAVAGELDYKKTY